MANYVKVNVVCPCGRLLKTASSNVDAGGIMSGTMVCSSCKKKVRYQISRGSAFTSYLN